MGMSNECMALYKINKNKYVNYYDLFIQDILYFLI